MRIVEIYKPYIYSVQYVDNDENEFDRLLDLWNNADYVENFFYRNHEYLKSAFWGHISEIEAASRQVFDEAIAIEDLFEELYKNTSEGKKPDFESHFKFLDGKYKYQLSLIPMKSYGTNTPSLLRIYAIRLNYNQFIITGGGIKLADTIQHSPDLKDHVIQNIDKVIDYINEQGIIDMNDLVL